MPQSKEPGAEAEVDFGPVTVRLDGREAACQMFAYRLSFSGLGVHRVYASCAQEALQEGHVTAFAVTGGVPAAHIRYDNLTPAVTKVLKGRDRKENARWLSFRSWYGFDAFYCEPGVEGAHEGASRKILPDAAGRAAAVAARLQGAGRPLPRP